MLVTPSSTAASQSLSFPSQISTPLLVLVQQRPNLAVLEVLTQMPPVQFESLVQDEPSGLPAASAAGALITSSAKRSTMTRPPKDSSQRIRSFVGCLD